MERLVANLMVYDISERRNCNEWVRGVTSQLPSSNGLSKELRELALRAFDNQRIVGLVAFCSINPVVDVTVFLAENSRRLQRHTLIETDYLRVASKARFSSKSGSIRIGLQPIGTTLEGLTQLVLKAEYDSDVSIQAAFFHRANEVGDVKYAKKLGIAS